VFHPHRSFIVLDVDSPQELADLVTGPGLPLEIGFRLLDTIFVNDSVSPFGPQVYAVVRAGHQLDALEFSAYSLAEATDHIRGIVTTPRSAYPGAPHPEVHLALEICPLGWPIAQPTRPAMPADLGPYEAELALAAWTSAVDNRLAFHAGCSLADLPLTTSELSDLCWAGVPPEEVADSLLRDPAIGAGSLPKEPQGTGKGLP
jgi:hypothetical protein